MFDPEKLIHNKFEELCALAALGQISTKEFSELQDHLATCSSCRSIQQDFLEIIHEHLPLVAPDEVQSRSSKIAFHDSSYKQRFLQRIQQEGLLPSLTPLLTNKKPIKRHATQTSWSETIGFYVLSAAAAVVLAVFSFTEFKWYWSGTQNPTDEVKYLKEELANFQQKLSLTSQLNNFPKKELSFSVFSPSMKLATRKSSTDSSQLLADLAKSKEKQRLTLKQLNTQMDYLGKAEVKLIALDKQLEETQKITQFRPTKT